MTLSHAACRSSPGRRAALVCGSLLVALAACSRDGTSESTARVRVLARAYLSQAPLLIAEEEGYFAEEGIEVELVSLANAREGLPALIQGDLDVISATVGPPFLNAIARGAMIRTVANRGYLDPGGCAYLAFVTRPELLHEGELVVPPPESGRRLQVSWSREMEHLTGIALTTLGLDLDDVELVRVEGAEELQALVAGRIDLATNTGDPVRRVVDSGQAAIWRTGQSVLPGFEFGALLFGPNLLERDRALGVRFLTAYLRGLRQYNLGKTDRNLEVLARRTSLDREALEQTCWLAMREDGRIDAGSMDLMQEWAVQRGTLSRVLRADELWDPSLIVEAARRLERRGPDRYR